MRSIARTVFACALAVALSVIATPAGAAMVPSPQTPAQRLNASDGTATLTADNINVSLFKDTARYIYMQWTAVNIDGYDWVAMYDHDPGPIGTTSYSGYDDWQWASKGPTYGTWKTGGRWWIAYWDGSGSSYRLVAKAHFDCDAWFGQSCRQI